MNRHIHLDLLIELADDSNSIIGGHTAIRVIDSSGITLDGDPWIETYQENPPIEQVSIYLRIGETQ